MAIMIQMRNWKLMHYHWNQEFIGCKSGFVMMIAPLFRVVRAVRETVDKLREDGHEMVMFKVPDVSLFCFCFLCCVSNILKI